MSFQAVNWAIEQRTGSPGAKAILWSIANYANEDGVCWPSQALIAKESEQSPDTVQRRLPALVSAGLVRRIPLRFQGRRSVDFFIIARSKWFAAPAAEIEHLLPRGHEIDPSHCEDIDVAVSSGAAADCGHALPQTLPQPDGNAAALLRQQEPVTDPTEPIERECARVREEGSKRFARDFRKRWPTAAIDDQARLSKALDLLPDTDRGACLEGIEPFLEDLKRHKRGHVPAGWRYVEERRWTLLPPRGKPDAAIVAVQCWSREWWGLLLAKIAASAPTGFMVQYASAPGKHETAARASEMPSADALAQMRSFPSDGCVVQAWRPWFDRYGVKLPTWRDRVWVWLPAEAPPPDRSAWQTPQATSPPMQPSESDLREFDKL